MFAKLVFLILAFGAIACGLLVVRQQRIDLAHDMSRTHQRLVEHEQTEWHYRSDIATRTRPDLIRQQLNQTNIAWQPLHWPSHLHQHYRMAFEREPEPPDRMIPASYEASAPNQQ